MSLERDIKSTIRQSLGLSAASSGGSLNEAYVVEPKPYSFKTEFLSDKTKRARIDDFNESVKCLNGIAARLDTADRDGADSRSSEFRSLKDDETRCINDSFLRSKFFDNIDDPRSQITMDTLTFMRLERDWGTFDTWQRDFIACGMSARSGYVVTAYNMMLKRYMNHVVDSGCGLPAGTFPVIVLDVSEGAYYRDYLADRKTYIVSMMKELNWDVIEDRFKKAERIAKVLA
jgi:Fe-Mn family superoxide dismutase